MSLVGFKARNHPQQDADPNVDDRAITPGDFAPLHARFAFTIDAAASAANARLPRYWTLRDDALRQPWTGERVWCNPPYSNIASWVRKAHKEYSLDGTAIVMLLPANRTEQKWWQELVEPRRDMWRMEPGQCEGLQVEFLPGRMRFLRNGATDIKPNERPPFGCCLLIWSARAA